MRTSGLPPTPETGGATVLVAAACLVVLTLGAAGSAATGAAYASARARTAADLAAVAGATARLSGLIDAGGPDPCAVAASVADANGAALTRCLVDGPANVTVAVVAPTPALVRSLGREHAAASARAGPAAAEPP